jgi:ribosomal protein S18 acetylase RimI-like enzyme
VVVVTVRPQVDDDVEAIAALHAAVPHALEHDFEPRSADDLRRFDAVLAAKDLRRARYVAEADGALVGVATAFHLPWDHAPGRFWVGVRTTPSHRRRGVGRSLWAALADELARAGATELRGELRETELALIASAFAAGVTERFRSWDLRLDLAAAPTPPPGPDAGLSVVSVAQHLAEHRHALPALRDLFAALYAEVPLPGFLDTDPSLDDFADLLSRAPTARADVGAVARLGDAPVGLAILHQNVEEPGRLDHHFTGVSPAGRGRGVARALKRHALLAARAAGFGAIQTCVESNNPAMLAINQSLGFQVLGGLVVWQADLTTARRWASPGS